jgi:hypothetical protein
VPAAADRVSGSGDSAQRLQKNPLDKLLQPDTIIL